MRLRASLLAIHSIFNRPSLPSTLLSGWALLVLTGPSAAAPFTVGLRRDFSTATGPAAVAIADVNADAKLDLVIANFTAGSFSIRLGSGTGNFGALSSFVTGAGAQSIATGD